MLFAALSLSGVGPAHKSVLKITVLFIVATDLGVS